MDFYQWAHKVEAKWKVNRINDISKTWTQTVYVCYLSVYINAGGSRTQAVKYTTHSVDRSNCKSIFCVDIFVRFEFMMSWFQRFCKTLAESISLFELDSEQLTAFDERSG